MHDKANVALVLEQAYMGQLHALNRQLSAARSTISEREKRIAELEAERDQFREYAREITKTLTGLVGGGSEMFSGRIANGTDSEMFKADLPFCSDRIRRRFDVAHEAIKGEARERQRREEAEAIARPLAQGWHSYGNAEEGKLELLRGTLGIWHFKEAAEHFRKYEPGK